MSTVRKVESYRVSVGLKIFPAVKSSHDNQSELSAKQLLWFLDFSRGSGLYKDHMVTKRNDACVKSEPVICRLQSD